MRRSGNRRKSRQKKAGIIICFLSITLIVILTLLMLLIFHPELFKKRDSSKGEDRAAAEKPKGKGWDDIVEWDWIGKAADDGGDENDHAGDADVRKIAAEGYMKAAEAFAEHLSQTVPAAEDTARYGLFDMDSDSVPELIMHDLTGEYACFCSCRDAGVTEPSVLFDNYDDESSFKSCALFPDRNLQLIYEISGKGQDDPYCQSIKTDICGLDADGVLVVRDSILMEVSVGSDEPDIRYRKLTQDDEREIGRDEYLSILAGHAGEDITQRFRLDDGLTDIIEGSYDFGAGRSEAGTRRLQRLTLEELREALAGISKDT